MAEKDFEDLKQKVRRMNALTVLLLIRGGFTCAAIAEMDGQEMRAGIEAMSQLGDPEATRLLLINGCAVPPRLFEMPIVEWDACA